MEYRLKRVMAIHDLSGLGRSSLMAVTPVMSVMGIQVCPVPTAILSTQTSGFQGYTFIDLTTSMSKYLAHWETLHEQFQGIYSGFLGSAEQVSIVEKAIEHFADKNTLVVVDPVLGDDGVLYDTMDMQMVNHMRRLIRKADLITPNMTEVKLLLGLPAEEIVYAEQSLPALEQLAQLGPKTIVVTGVHKSDGGKCVCSYQRETKTYDQIDYQELPASYPGTGDIFTSVLLGGLLQKRTLHNSISLATEFVYHTVKDALVVKEPVRNGVQLEKNLYRLV